MCFRPAGAEQKVICPSCGKEVPVMGGVKLKTCPFCKADLPDEPAAGVPTAPGAPQAPGAPVAPKAPGAPQAPGAPKPPAL
jgi:hypothetical protein